MTCGHKKHEELYKFDKFSLYRCENCNLVFSDKYREDFNIRTYDDYYKNEMAGRFNFGIECIIRLFRFFRAFKIFTLYPKAKSILDIGSGRGFMLYYLKKYYGYKKAIGTQISKNALLFSMDKLGLEIYDKDLLELQFEPESFDLITIWHVLEHVKNPGGLY